MTSIEQAEAGLHAVRVAWRSQTAELARVRAELAKERAKCATCPHFIRWEKQRRKAVCRRGSR